MRSNFSNTVAHWTKEYNTSVPVEWHLFPDFMVQFIRPIFLDCQKHAYSRCYWTLYTLLFVEGIIMFPTLCCRCHPSLSISWRSAFWWNLGFLTSEIEEEAIQRDDVFLFEVSQKWLIVKCRIEGKTVDVSLGVFTFPSFFFLYMSIESCSWRISYTSVFLKKQTTLLRTVWRFLHEPSSNVLTLPDTWSNSDQKILSSLIFVYLTDWFCWCFNGNPMR